MEAIITSIRNIFFGAVVLFINIPVFWSFADFAELVKDIAGMIGA